jgi:hypothetical protein
MLVLVRAGVLVLVAAGAVVRVFVEKLTNNTTWLSYATHRWIVSRWDTATSKWIDRADDGVPLSFDETRDLQQGTIVKVFAGEKKAERHRRHQLSEVKFWVAGSHQRWKGAHIVVK